MERVYLKTRGLTTRRNRRRRAEAVRAVLVSQFKVDASRLTTAGLGATKPLDTNDTPQGRSQNRRVEFVKQ